MKRQLSCWAYAVVLACLVAAGFAGPSAPARPVSPRLAGDLLPEVRMRKVHLVRPDLIRYPIAYDVYC